jgi:hypothetical protein
MMTTITNIVTPRPCDVTRSLTTDRVTSRVLFYFYFIFLFLFYFFIISSPNPRPGATVKTRGNGARRRVISVTSHRETSSSAWLHAARRRVISVTSHRETSSSAWLHAARRVISVTSHRGTSSSASSVNSPPPQSIISQFPPPSQCRYEISLQFYL